MNRGLLRAVLIVAAISIWVDCLAQVTSFSTRRRVTASIWRFDEIGDPIDQVKEDLVNYDPGEYSFSAGVSVAGAECLASQNVEWVFNEGCLIATGILSLDLSQSEEGTHRWFTANSELRGYFSTASPCSLQYWGVATGDPQNILYIERVDTGVGSQIRFPIDMGEFFYSAPLYEPGSYEVYINFLENYNDSVVFHHSGNCDFTLSVTPSTGVAVDGKGWGAIKALFR